MQSQRPPDFNVIADADTKNAFIGGRPEVVQLLQPGTKLFKWAKAITTRRGISPWWMFIEPRQLGTGSRVPGIRDLQTYAARLRVHDRDYTRVRLAVTEEWNRMSRAMAIELLKPAWGYIGKAAGQRKNLADPDVLFIGGEYQVWVPNLTANDFRQISILPHLTPNAARVAKL